MALSLRYLVPEEYEYWYFHEESGLLLHSDPEYGWVACKSLDKVEGRVIELKEAIGRAKLHGGISDTSDVLPLPDDYEHTKWTPPWKNE